jgi:hypothetical protein
MSLILKDQHKIKMCLYGKNTLRIFIIILQVVVFVFPFTLFPQQDFIKVKDTKFFLNDKEFSFLGFNAYYLQDIYSTSKRYIIDDVLRVAEEFDLKVIRTWGFNEGVNSNTRIRLSPYVYNEEGLIALDYVVSKAKEYNIKLIITLANYYPAYGGIPQYLRWASEMPDSSRQFSVNDFFTHDSLKAWYKHYMKTILNRINVFTGTYYKDEPAIFGFELINEAANPQKNSSVLTNWYDEMSRYFKSIDSVHLLSTGEEGYDSDRHIYSDVDFFYNSSYFLFNGYKGTSFYANTLLEKIDYASFHLYPRGWQLNNIAGNTWIKDHTRIADLSNKPSLPGEFGTREEKERYYRNYLEVIRETSSRSALFWHYVHPDLNYSDGYELNEIANPGLFELFKEHIALINSGPEPPQILSDKDFTLLQNYPNPFNPVTTITYHISKPQYIKLLLYTNLGELIKVIDEGFKPAGVYKLNLSFDDILLASTVYFYTLLAETGSETKKLILLK